MKSLDELRQDEQTTGDLVRDTKGTVAKAVQCADKETLD